MFDLMLVPLDGSEAAEAALTVAALIPSRRIRLLAVESDSVDLTAICSAAQDCHEYLERVAEPLRRQGRKVETTVAFGNPAATRSTADALGDAPRRAP